MKKIIVFLLFLLALGGTVYYLGTVPVSPGRVAVVYSGLSGLLPDILTTPGRHFLWHRLIPGDTEIYSYPEKSAEKTVSLLFRLPPGELPVFGRKKEFEVELGITIRIETGKKSPLLLAAAGFRTIDAWLETVLGRRGRSLKDMLSKTAEEAILKNTPPNLGAAIKKAGEDGFLKQAQQDASLYAVRITALEIKAVRLPDPENYFRMRRSLAASSPELADRLRQHYKSRFLDRQTQAQNETELKRLLGIAKLVTKYPKLLDYMAVTRLSDKLKLAILPAGQGDTVKGDTYRALVRKLLSRLPGQQPVNINIKNGGGKTTVSTNGK